MMNLKKLSLYVGMGLCVTHPVLAADQAVRVEAWYSSDSDGTEVTRSRLGWNVQHADIEHYRGIELENVDYHFRHYFGDTSRRAFVRAADTIDDSAWKWNARIGSDGDTWLGDGSIYKDVPNRQEVFFERDVVETPRGVTEGLRSTYVGAAYDLPINDRQVVTALVGAQDFTGDNLRLHLRGRYIHVIKPSLGLSAQLRVRYFQNSEPFEYDYFSPKWYAEVLPVVQIRRFHQRWQYTAAAGIGRQKHAGTAWYPSRFAEAMVISPTVGRDWFFKGGFTYSESPFTSVAADNYRYRQFRLELTRRF